MAKRPTVEQFDIAIQILDQIEGSRECAVAQGDAEACQAVARWVEAQAAKLEHDRTVRQIAKEKGMDTMTVRAILRKQTATTK